MLRWFSLTVVGLVVLGCQSGAGSGARARLTITDNDKWKALKCPYESDKTVEQRLNTIIQRAKNDGMNGDPEVKVKVAEKERDGNIGAAPGLLASSVFVFITSLDEFTGTFFIGLPFVNTLPLTLYSASGSNMQFSSVIGVLLLIPSILFMSLVQKLLKAEYVGGMG